MKENTQSIQIGREYIHDLSAKELETLNHFIQDFLSKENEIPNAVLSEESEGCPPKQMLVYKDIFYDFYDRRFETGYSLFVGNDSITEISGEELIRLYLTLRSFLFQSEQFEEGVTQSTCPPIKLKKKEINVTPYTSREQFTESEETPPFINKRTWITDDIPSPQSDYTLSTPKGSVFRMCQEDLLGLSQRIGLFLSTQTDN